MGPGSLRLAFAKMQLNLAPLRIATSIACAVLVALTLPGGLLAGTSGPGAPGSVSSADRSTSVRGVVWNADNSPLPYAKVRLRNLQTGRVDAAAAANENGQFAFDNLEGGSYVIELLDDNDKVIAVGQSFRVERGETVATFVRLGTRRPGLSGLFSNTAAAVIAAASGVGVTAIGSQAPPASPQ
jgi:hypothetical protein